MLVNKIVEHLREYIESLGYSLLFSNQSCAVSDETNDSLTTIHFDTFQYWEKEMWRDFTLSDPNILNTLKSALKNDIENLRRKR